MELINPVSDECLWGEAYIPLIIPETLKTSLSIGVWCEAQIFQSIDCDTVFIFKVQLTLTYLEQQMGQLVLKSGCPKTQEHTISSPSKNFRDTLSELVCRWYLVHSELPPFSSTTLHPILHMFIDNDHITVWSWYMSKAGPLSALKKDDIWEWRENPERTTQYIAH